MIQQPLLKQSQFHLPSTYNHKYLLYLGNKSTHHLYFHQLYQIKFEKYIIQLNAKDLPYHSNIYQWRSKTTFPLVKTYHHNIIQSNHQSITLEIYNEHFQVRLSHLYEIPFNQLLYIIKQALFGFERLSNKFGRFLVTSKMIGINEKRQCKVWINECYEYNNTNPNQCTQAHFIMNILEVMKERSRETLQSKQFFSNAMHNLSFFTIFAFIDQFIYTHKIKIPKKFSFISNVQSSYLKKKIGVYKSLNSRRSVKSSRCSKMTSSKKQTNQQLSHQFNLSLNHQQSPNRHSDNHFTTSTNTSHRKPFHMTQISLLNNLEVVESQINEKQLLHKGSQGTIAIQTYKNPAYSSQNVQSIIEQPIKQNEYNKYPKDYPPNISKYGWQLTVNNIFQSNCDINKSMEVDDEIQQSDNTLLHLS